ncbi:MAG TPA: trypsin-like peptidase domain-containing protein [Candidatus Saccharimonadales bacterium]|nr:trypsin-like peptidase domain-containing protein [Candidatus Saccharimonadales bacterium]
MGKTIVDMVLDRFRGSNKAPVSKYSTVQARAAGQRPDWFVRGLLLAIVILLLGFGGGWLGAKTYNDNLQAPSSTAAKQKIISGESDLISNIATDSGPGVVSIDVERQVNSQDVFGFGTTQTQAAAGTGFIINKDGTIVTNRHVVPSGTSSVSVTLADGTKYDNVKVIGRTNSSSPLDVAFLKITDLKGKILSPLTLGDSGKVKVGDKVVAIGNALGQFQNTVTSGIISGFGRDVSASDDGGSGAETLTDLFQTDAAINAGNSGGPLMNINNEVIGINTAVAGGAQNIGFAIPINDIKGLISSVLKNGQLKQPFLGVRYVSLTDDLAENFNLTVKRGAYILPGSGSEPSVVKDSPADKAGLRAADIITQVNDTKIDEKNSLSSVLGRYQVGDTIKMTVIRGDEHLTLTATLEAAPSN